MNFWQKIYLSTLFLFLLLFDICLFLIVNSVYQNNLNNAKQSVLNNEYHFQSTLQKELEALFDRYSDNLPYDSLMSSYGAYYKKQNIYICLWNGDNLIYNSLPFDDIRLKLNSAPNGKYSMIFRNNSMNYFCISSNLEGDFNNHKLIFIHKLEDLEHSMYYLFKQCLGFHIIGSILLTLFLLLLLRHLTKPLSVLSNASNIIAEGNYSNRIQLKGHDEFTQLSLHFNHMADEIQKKVISLENESERKQIFINNLAHEINTPLTSLHGYSEYMLHAPTTEEDRYEILLFMIKETKRLSLLGKQLLSLAKLKNEELLFQEIQISSLYESMKKSLKFIMEKKQIHLTLNKNVDIIRGDYVLFESLIRNLIENSIHACSENGEIKLSFCYTQGETKIIVRDNGKGMAETELSHITEPFYRTDKSRSRADGGTGLGLSLCKQIVEYYDGNIEFSSKKGEGTKVEITFTTS